MLNNVGVGYVLIFLPVGSIQTCCLWVGWRRTDLCPVWTNPISNWSRTCLCSMLERSYWYITGCRTVLP